VPRIVELAARHAGVGVDDRDFDDHRRAGLALSDAFDLGGTKVIKLPAALALLRGTNLAGVGQ
jgi:hypothetical protein